VPSFHVSFGISFNTGGADEFPLDGKALGFRSSSQNEAKDSDG